MNRRVRIFRRGDALWKQEYVRGRPRFIAGRYAGSPSALLGSSTPVELVLQERDHLKLGAQYQGLDTIEFFKADDDLCEAIWNIPPRTKVDALVVANSPFSTSNALTHQSPGKQEVSDLSEVANGVLDANRRFSIEL